MTATGSPQAAQVYSRFRGGDTSFGMVGRVLITLFWLLSCAWLVVFNTLGGVLWLILGPFVLKDVWKKVRVR